MGFSKKSLIILILFCSCSKKSGSTEQGIKSSANQSQIEITNSNGKFGEIYVLNKAKFNFILENKSAKTVKITDIKFTNNNFKFELPFPGISSASTKLGTDSPCSFSLEKNKRCVFSVTFQPTSPRPETGDIVIDYSIDSNKMQYSFNISGVGKEKTQALKALEKLKTTFSKVSKKSVTTPVSADKVIESVLAIGHSKKFAYDDFFNSLGTKGIEVLNKQLSVERVIGYTFRADRRAPVIPWASCDSEWKNGYKLKNPINEVEITYPGNPTGTNCGIKDIGGFFPTATRKSDIEKINQMLINYKNTMKKDFDPSVDNFNILASFPTSSTSILSTSDSLNWWLQSILNLSAHVHNEYNYKGFISTTTNINLARSWGGGNRVIYAVYIEGGYLLPSKFDASYKLKTGQTFSNFDENEVAVPGAILWEDVMAYLEPGQSIMVRDGFEAMDKHAYDMIINAFSSVM